MFSPLLLVCDQRDELPDPLSPNQQRENALLRGESAAGHVQDDVQTDGVGGTASYCCRYRIHELFTSW